jgi:hypothetical protein
LNSPASFPKVGGWMAGKEVRLYLDRAIPGVRVSVDVRIEEEEENVYC